MISVCIPIYNFDVRPLVSDLVDEMQKLDAGCEIICIDDASEDDFKNINGNYCDKHGTYIQLYENVGRAQIRNLFLPNAKNDYLLFLDCDSLVYKKDFLESYIKCIKEKEPLIVCGGRVYPKEKPDRHFMLRWKYGWKREVKSLKRRIKKSHISFQTNNFLIHKELFKQVQFEGSITQYGHEDTLFGFMMKQIGIPILHIDNPILNGEIETNQEFLYKSELAVENLVYMNALLNYNKDFIAAVNLLKWYYRLKKMRLLFCVSTTSFFCKKYLHKKLLSGSGYGTMFKFNLYKLILLHEKTKKMTVKS
ncbi:MAG: glycosyltransferase family 2 protein [Bacteroidales bacterium]|nr:glycosyltransferase family 2 protein [Bacteroidales bacterium]